MRFSFHTPLFVFPLALAASSLGMGCSYPFEVDVSSAVTLPLGAAVNCAEANAGVLEGTIPANGEPDKHGNLTRFEHRFSEEGNRCALHAEWEGPLVDMEAMRADAEDEMRKLGLEPDDVDVYIREIEPRVTAVGFDGGDLPGGVSYRANVGVPNASKVIMLEAAEGSNLMEPKVTMGPNQRRLLRNANKAYREREPMPGIASVDIEIDLGEAGMEAELPESIRVDFDMRLFGDAAARLMVDKEHVDRLTMTE